MGIARSTFYDRPERPADDTAVVEAMVAVCDEFEFMAIVASEPPCASRASSSTTRSFDG